LQAGKAKNNTSLYHAPVSSKEEALLPLLLGSTAVSLLAYENSPSFFSVGTPKCHGINVEPLEKQNF